MSIDFQIKLIKHKIGVRVKLNSEHLILLSFSSETNDSIYSDSKKRGWLFSGNSIGK